MWTGLTYSEYRQNSTLKVTSAHRLTVIPVGIAGIDTLNCGWTLLHDKAWRAGESNSGAQLICDITAAKISMGHEGFPAVFIIKCWKKKQIKTEDV